MPTYKNNSQHRRTIGSEIIESGQEKKLLTYYNLRGSSSDGISIIDDYPYYSPIVLSEKIEENKIIEIPKLDFFGEFLDKYNLHFYVEKGEISISFNAKNNKVPLKLYTEAKWNIRCSQRLIDKMYITSEKDFLLWVIVEKTL